MNSMVNLGPLFTASAQLESELSGMLSHFGTKTYMQSPTGSAHRRMRRQNRRRRG